jgi:hypothetical protein
MTGCTYAPPATRLGSERCLDLEMLSRKRPRRYGYVAATVARRIAHAPSHSRRGRLFWQGRLFSRIHYLRPSVHILWLRDAVLADKHSRPDRSGDSRDGAAVL